jgi:hypothetical protein
MNNTEGGIMELGTGTTARIAADILIAALGSNAIPPGARGPKLTTKEVAEEIGEAFTIIHRAVLDAANGTPP